MAISVKRNFSDFSLGVSDGEGIKRRYVCNNKDVSDASSQRFRGVLSSLSEDNREIRLSLNLGNVSYSKSSNGYSCNHKQSETMKNDLRARERCFDYIIQGIDEVWDRYCNSTSNAEQSMYNSNNSGNSFSKTHTRNRSMSTSLSKSYKQAVASPVSSDLDDDEDDYKSEATNLTEYESEYESSNQAKNCSMKNYEFRTCVSNLPDSIKLEALKIKLSKVKNDLECIYDSSETCDSVEFWKKWDMIKYNTIEMMEDDDDDEVIEAAIKDLEKGRFFTE